MSAIQYLNELETERLSILNEKPPVTPTEKADWWERLGEWWRKRDLGFGDGQGMRSHCLAMAEKNRQIAECEFCGETATRIEKFDRDVSVCNTCYAGDA